jgi:hypothetical protein
MTVRSKALTVMDQSNTGIVGSNHDRVMDIYPRFSLFWYPV